MFEILDEILERGIQVIWQTGALDYGRIKLACEGKTMLRFLNLLMRLIGLILRVTLCFVGLGQQQ
jgi:hypothetical protein